MEMKLAEYNSDGKFKRFLEIGKDFLFGDKIIIINHGENLDDLYGVPEWRGEYYFKDARDPLNRFSNRHGESLFNGRTYGEGRFVLDKIWIAPYHYHEELDQFGVENKKISTSDIIEVFYIDKKDDYSYHEEGLIDINGMIKSKGKWSNSHFHFLNANIYDCDYSTLRLKVIGNLHENPELWEKIK